MKKTEKKVWYAFYAYLSIDSDEAKEFDNLCAQNKLRVILAKAGEYFTPENSYKIDLEYSYKYSPCKNEGDSLIAENSYFAVVRNASGSWSLFARMTDDELYDYLIDHDIYETSADVDEFGRAKNLF